MFRRFIAPTYLLAILSTLLLVGIVVATVLFVQALEGTRSDLELTRIDLVEEQTRNSTLQGKNEELESSLDQSRVRIEQLEASVESTSEELAYLRADNDTLSRAHADLLENFKQLQGELALEGELHRDTSRLLSGTRVEIEALSGELTDARAENETLTGDLETASAEKETLRVDLARARHELNTLSNAVGGLERVKEERDRLNEEIERLEEMRQPLLLEAETSGFACTGSMEPKITCLDSADFLNNFKPVDIVVGTIISFTEPPECNPSGDDSYISHRVIEIRVEDGKHHFRTKGDANEHADECWVPEDLVDSYMIGLEKNTHPENESLRSKVNNAKAAMLEAEAIYYDTHLRYCRVPVGNPCPASDSRFQELMRLYDLWATRIDDYNCWLENAGRRQIGPINVYVSCPLT